MSWNVRHEGSPTSVEVPTAQAVLVGLADGNWEPTDEVRGPNDPDWRTIADHPLFAEAVFDMEPARVEAPDDSHLDMNPLIDVAMVLLIFFILTTTYESLRRTIELPPEPKEGKVERKTDIKDKTFQVEIRMNAGKPTIKIGESAVTLDELEFKVKEAVRTTGRREMYAIIDDQVPWGIEAKLYDAAKAAGITQIWWPKPRK